MTKPHKVSMSEAKWDCKALNELLRHKTSRGQEEIDNEAQDIKVQLKRKYRDAKST